MKDLVTQTAEGRWFEILSALCPSLDEAIHKAGRGHVTCPIHGGKADFRFHRSKGDEFGLSFCSCGKRNGYQLIMDLHGVRFGEAQKMVAQYLGIDRMKHTDRLKAAANAKKLAKERRARRERLQMQEARELHLKRQKVWYESFPLDAPESALGRRYFHIRKLDPSVITTAVRFHPNLALYDENQNFVGHYPALVSMVFSNKKKRITLHRTYLDPKTGKKLRNDAKKMMKVSDLVAEQNAGRIIPVINRENSNVLGIAEGLETAIAAHQLFNIPVWSVISTGGMAKFVPPAGIDRLVIYADQDVSGAGLEAALKLRESLAELGWPGIVQIVLPERSLIPVGSKGVDFCDMNYHQIDTRYCEVA